MNRTLEDILEENVPQQYWKVPDKNGEYSRKGINEMIADGTIDLSKVQFIDLHSRSVKEKYAFTLRAAERVNFHLTDKEGLRVPTERERFRLMGVDDETINKILSLDLCRTKYIIMAGNSIVVDVLYYLFRNLFSLIN